MHTRPLTQLISHELLLNPDVRHALVSVGLFTVYFIFLQKYLYNKYSLLIYIYIYINQ